MPAEQTLEFIRAQDLILVGRFAQPRSIAGWSITFQVRDSLGGASRIIKTVGSGITLTDAGKGIIEITLTKADTQGLAVQSYVWDIKRTDAGANVVLAMGQLILRHEVTT
ncbi:MAG TPA: hypothetical protein VNK04_21075 [Gemmataceae bacterium]|nr:hypothetical protein [Gemmataceae bacterium]